MTLKSAKEFWFNVKTELARQNITQKELCKRCGFNEGSFKNRISKATFPTIDEVYRISQFLDVSIDKLVGLQTTNLSENSLIIANKVNRLPQKYQMIILDMINSFIKYI